MRRSLAISSTSRYRWLLLLASLLAFSLSGCVEVAQHSRVHDAGLVSVKFMALVEPQYEARVLPVIKKELVTKLSAGVDFISMRRGTILHATSTVFAFNFGWAGKSGSSPAVAATGVPSWLMPVSIASICVGIALLLIGWFRSRQTSHSRALPHAIATPSMPAPTEHAGSVFCSECGARNALGRKFCSQCGHDLG